MRNQLLALAYDSVDPAKAERLRSCADLLVYQQGEDGNKHLVSANFCRVRLCPICAWRRSLKVYSQMSAILSRLKLSGKNYAYIMLTLTVRNVDGVALSSTLDQLMEGYRRLMMYARVRALCKGAYRGVEITHNVRDDTYHPHIHALIAVTPSYFNSRLYVSQAEWAAMWQRALKIDYIPVLHVQRCKGDTAASISEVAKYAVKSSDIIIPDDWDLTVETVRLLDEVLDRRRFVSFSGVFKQIAAELRLDDAEDGDLLHVSDEVADNDPLKQYIYYVWHTGYNQYVSD